MARIGFDARLYGYRHGGIAQYATQLARALVPVLAQEGHELIVYHTPHGVPQLPPNPHVRLATIHTGPHSRLEQATLPLEIRGTAPNLVHSPDFIPPRVGSWLRVITVHDLDFLRQPHRLNVDARKYYEQIHWAVQEADAIIAVSDATKRDLVSLLAVPEERVSVIYEAADSRFIPASPSFPNPAPPEGTPETGQYFLMVGTIEPRKNHETVLNAYQKYRASTDTTPLELVIVGQDGWNSERTVERIRTTVGVRWFPHIENTSEMVALYQNAAALLQPSWDEGFGLTVLEAMACGTPVAISNARALQEIAGDAALEAPSDDVAAWMLVMDTLAQSVTTRDDLRQRGIARAADFSWERAARETAALYNRVFAAHINRRTRESQR